MTPPPNRWNALLLLPALLALAVAGRVVLTFMGRLPYPYDLEWMEGGVLAHAWRLQHGLPIYAPPSPEFIPMVYPPGYYAVVAVLGEVFGLTAPVARAVSVFSTLAAAAALVWGAGRHLGRPLAGLLAAGIFLGCYEDSGAFYDLVRPDALSLGCLAWALVLAPEASPRRQVGAGLLLFCAFAAKHNAASYGLPMALGLWAWHGRAAALRLGLAAAVPGLLFTVGMQLATDGHFLGYLWEVPRSHPSVEARWIPGTVREIGASLAVVCAGLAAWSIAVGARAAPRVPLPVHAVLGMLGGAAAVWIVGSLPEIQGIPPSTPTERTCASLLLGAGTVSLGLGVLGGALQRRWSGPWLYGALVLATAFVTGGLMRAHHGGFMNVFMPLHWSLAAGFAALLADLEEQLDGRAAALLDATAALLQLGLIWDRLDLERLLPDEADWAAGDEVVEALREHEGPVFSPFASYLPALAGHAPSTHLIALWDVRHKEGPYHAEAGKVIHAVSRHYWRTILDAPETMGYGVAKHYTKDQVIPLSGRALMPRTGWRRRPGVLWVPSEGPKGADAPPAAGRDTEDGGG